MSIQEIEVMPSLCNYILIKLLKEEEGDEEMMELLEIVMKECTLKWSTILEWKYTEYECELKVIVNYYGELSDMRYILLKNPEGKYVLSSQIRQGDGSFSNDLFDDVIENLLQKKDAVLVVLEEFSKKKEYFQRITTIDDKRGRVKKLCNRNLSSL